MCVPLDADYSDIYTLDGIDGQPKWVFSFIASDEDSSIEHLGPATRSLSNWAISNRQTGEKFAALQAFRSAVLSSLQFAFP